MNKKLFILCLVLICVGLFFGWTYNAFAGNLRGRCICSGCPESEGEVVYSIEAPDHATLAEECTERCTDTEYEGRDWFCESGGLPPSGERGAITCLASGEMYDLETEECEAAAAPAGGASEKKGTEKKDSKTQSIKAITLPNPLGTTDVRVVIGNIIRAVLGVIGSIALVLFMYGGFLWMTAAGDPNKAKKGQQTIIQATIGLVIIFISYTLVNFVLSSLTSIGETTTEEERKE